MKLAVALVLALLTFATRASAAPIDPPEPVGPDVQSYDTACARPIKFLTFYQYAGTVSLEAGCFSDASATGRRLTNLLSQLSAIQEQAQQRNPDIDLSSLAGSSGCEESHISPSEYQETCEARDRANALKRFPAAMQMLRRFVPWETSAQ